MKKIVISIMCSDRIVAQMRLNPHPLDSLPEKTWDSYGLMSRKASEANGRWSDRVDKGDAKAVYERELVREDKLTVSRLRKDPEVALLGSTPIDNMTDAELAALGCTGWDDPRIRYRYKFVCPHAEVLIQGERLWPLLDQLHAAGKHKLSLDALERVLTS